MRNVAMRADYPRAHFQLQLTTVEQFGHKAPMKPENGTDDLFRTAVLCHSQIRRHQDEYRDPKLFVEHIYYSEQQLVKRQIRIPSE